MGEMKNRRTKRVSLEMTMLLPEGVDLNSATLLARITEVLGSLAGGDDEKRIKIETLKFDPG